MPTPGLAAFLSARSTDTPGQQRTRARLLSGRSRTGEVQLRFAKAAAAPHIDPHCTRCSTPAQPVIETIPHMLLDCIRHAVARTALMAALTALHCGPLLRLSTILCTRLPPLPFRPRRQLPDLLLATSAFLSAVHQDRSVEQLVPLDTG